MAITLPPTTVFPLLPDDAPHTTGELAYYLDPPNGEVPYDRLYDSDLPKTNVGTLRLTKPIYDLRPLVDAGRASETNTDVTGFQVIPKDIAKTVMKESDWDSDATIRSTYYQETIDLIKTVTGASKVIIFDHTIRKVERPGEETPDTPDSRKPVAKVHIDQTPASGRKRDAPLAVADARTLKNDHLVPSRLLYEAPTPEGETFQVQHSDGHRWYYLSDQSPDEALFLKCWDNAEDGGARTPHTGFKDDKYVGKEVALPRQSIEIRALVFHEL
ncbi:hypothetical protein RQP46_000239 [Phenoliferia psychrophenolica]